ncbi:MAG: methyltransferase domain-containing protein [Candidatus Thorarchaeota archaeon]
MKSPYYKQIAKYYDLDALDFEKRYSVNHILQKIRNDFRKVTERYVWDSALEIGIGPGMDLLYFSRKYPGREFYGIDISLEMIKIAREKLQENQITNVRIFRTVPENLNRMITPRIDLIYCYFGALNTVRSLESIVEVFDEILSIDGILVLTFINKWYLFDLVYNVMLLRFQASSARIKNTWKGYSLDKNLKTTCRSSKEISETFNPAFKLVEKKGYSIFYPAWPRARFFPRGRFTDLLWRIDQALNRTALWQFGEYSLYVFKRK